MLHHQGPKKDEMRADELSNDNLRTMTREESIKAQGIKLVDSIKKALFVIGTALIVFIAARNSVTWYAQKLWGASGSYWQNQWDNVYSLFGRNDFLIGAVGTYMMTFLVFWFGNAFLLVLDYTGRPSCLLKYKIQEDKNVPVDKQKLWKAIRLVLFNMTVVGFPFTCFSYLIFSVRGCSISGELPTLHWVLLELMVFALVEEIAFYYSHRLLHHPRLYKYIHKTHHEWTAPIGIVGLYAHPLEHVLSNLTPPLLGPLLMGSHLSSAWLWFALALLSTTVSHSGYHFPGLPSPEAHDYHHLKFNQCFGVLGVLDRLHGTDNQFRASVAYKRHIMLLSLVPMREQFPDPKICLKAK